MTRLQHQRTLNPHRWWALVGICGSAALVWLAFAELGVALPTIGEHIDAPLTQLQWINNAFGLACGALVLGAGWLCDRARERRVLVVGVAGFGVAALLTSLLSGLPALTTGRALMGVGAAFILPATLAIIPTQFPVRELPHAFAIWGAVAWVAQAAGPALSGLTTHYLGWRALFWIKLPLAVVAIAIILATCPRAAKWPPTHRLDVAGLLASGGAAFLVLFGCTLGADQGFTDPLTIVSLVAAGVLVVVLVLVERRAHHPIIEGALLRLRDVDGALLANSVMVFVFTGSSLLLAIYLQEVRGHSALAAGMLVLPATATIVALLPVGTRLGMRVGGRITIVAGLVTLGAGLLLVGQLAPDSTYLPLLAGLLVVGAGCGLLTAPLTHTAVAAPPPQLAGTASGLFKMSSMLGGSLGVAVLIAIAGPGATPEAETAGADHAIRVAGLLCLAMAAVIWWLWPRHARSDEPVTMPAEY